MAVQSSSFSSFSYQVFLSFRGTDTRHGFTGNLCKALRDSGIHTFFDDDELQRGEEITPALVKAIESSRIAIPIFSENYASSSFCLDELVHIMECFKSKGLLVLPVFYGVYPSQLRHQKGKYGEALARHEARFTNDKINKWKVSLKQAADLSGHHFKQGKEYEHEFIGNIVENVSRAIKRAALPIPIADYLVGLETKVLRIEKLLDVGSNDGIHMVGIHGIGGIGKTTLALAVYNSIANHFRCSCFLENVRENSSKHGLMHLQKILISELLGDKKIEFASVRQGIAILQDRLSLKKVLLILDDVDKKEQLEALVGKPDWFGPGSRVIITTRDQQLLAHHEIKRKHEVKQLSENDSRKLLNWKAFKTEEVNPSYRNVIDSAVNYASGLPLALEVIGSNLFGKSTEEWKSAINQYERNPKSEILKILKVSYDALEAEEQSVFLDIACCFKGYALKELEDILCAHYGDRMIHQISVLVAKSLIQINCNGKVSLHDLIEDMGKEIVRQESKEPQKRSRLWSPEDIVWVLEQNTGTRKIEMICLNFPLSEEASVEWDGEAFVKMKNLKTLIITNGHFSKGPEHLPTSLRVLEWWSYPSQDLPRDFHPKKLAICKIPYNSFASPTKLKSFSRKTFMNMRVLNVDHGQYLKQISDVSGLPNLEKISFESCENLITIHDSVGLLDKLKILNAYGCTRLKSFPPLKLPFLEELQLSCCSSLESFPEILGKMEKTTKLSLYQTAIKEFPVSFQNLNRLQQLELNLGGVFQLPRSIVMMQELVVINAWNWEGRATITKSG